MHRVCLDLFMVNLNVKLEFEYLRAYLHRVLHGHIHHRVHRGWICLRVHYGRILLHAHRVHAEPCGLRSVHGNSYGLKDPRRRSGHHGHRGRRGVWPSAGVPCGHMHRGCVRPGEGKGMRMVEGFSPPPFFPRS